MYIVHSHGVTSCSNFIFTKCIKLSLSIFNIFFLLLCFPGSQQQLLAWKYIWSNFDGSDVFIGIESIFQLKVINHWLIASNWMNDKLLSPGCYPPIFCNCNALVWTSTYFIALKILVVKNFVNACKLQTQNLKVFTCLTWQPECNYN